jgi:hypothetical protein
VQAVQKGKRSHKSLASQKHDYVEARSFILILANDTVLCQTGNLPPLRKSVIRYSPPQEMMRRNATRTARTGNGEARGRTRRTARNDQGIP